MPWLVLIARCDLRVRRPKLVLYFVGFVFWMGTLHWLRLPHWAANFGWVACSGYLAVYPLLFMLLSRVAVHRLGVSIVLAAPVVWTGLEVVRGLHAGRFYDGEPVAYAVPMVDVDSTCRRIGCYGMSGLVTLVAASVTRMMPLAGSTRAAWPIVPAALVFAVPLAYGTWLTSGEHTRPGATVALIQGTVDTTFDDEPGKDRRVMSQYGKLTRQAFERRSRDQRNEPALPDIDLIVWPESMFRSSLVSFSPDYEMPQEMQRLAKGRSKEEIEAELARCTRQDILRR